MAAGFPLSTSSWKGLETTLGNNLGYDPDLLLSYYFLRSLGTCCPLNPKSHLEFACELMVNKNSHSVSYSASSSL